MTSEGTTIRTSRSLAAIEAALDTKPTTACRCTIFTLSYVAASRRSARRCRPSPKASTQAGTRADGASCKPARAGLHRSGAFRRAGRGLGARAALAASLSGARPPLSMVARIRRRSWSAWAAAANGPAASARACFPPSVSLVDDPTMKEFKGQPLLGSYDVDDEGVKAQRVTLVDNGILKGLLMSRRPGPDFHAFQRPRAFGAAFRSAAAQQQPVSAVQRRA